MEDRIYEYFAAAIQDGYVGRLADIVEKAGGERNLYSMKTEHMPQKLMITDKLAAYISRIRDEYSLEYIKRELEYMDANGIGMVTYHSREYPKRLMNIESKPYALFVKGTLPQEGRKTVALIGSRQCTEYGRVVTEMFATGLAKRGVDIVSGMAWGIDGIGQMSAINAGGFSYAVLGCGVDEIYPRKNNQLYERLIVSGNGVISEYIPRTRAEARRFPPRNRIISGLCDVLLVVEARHKSGTLITVDMATEQGKNVMIVPGRITDPLSVGCLELLREGALLALNVDDVLNELGIGDEEGNQLSLDMDILLADDTDMPTDNDNMQQRVLAHLGLDPKSSETLAAELSVDASGLLTVLTRLELHGLIKEVSPFCFVRVYR